MRRLFFVAIMCLPVLVQGASIYKCKNTETGGVEYKSMPCAGASAQQNINPYGGTLGDGGRVVYRAKILEQEQRIRELESAQSSSSHRLQKRRINLNGKRK